MMLAGRRCLITGASRGLGAVIARTFWEAGASVALVARSRAALDALIATFPWRARQEAVALVADLSDPAASEWIVDAARQAFPSLDVLVNNAGIQGPIGALWENDEAAWRQTIQVNLLAPVALCRRCVPWMARAGTASVRGKIIHLSGGGGTGPRPYFSAYATAKAALVRFSETLALEVQDRGVDVNAVAPGAMGTAMMDAIMMAGALCAGQKEYDTARRTRGLAGETSGDEVLERAAALCRFLASADSDGLTGKLISAVWDPWETFSAHLDALQRTDVYTLRRIVPKDRGMNWGD